MKGSDTNEKGNHVCPSLLQMKTLTSIRKTGGLSISSSSIAISLLFYYLQLATCNTCNTQHSTSKATIRHHGTMCHPTSHRSSRKRKINLLSRNSRALPLTRPTSPPPMSHHQSRPSCRTLPLRSCLRHS
jgi:hypothetical protein